MYIYRCVSCCDNCICTYTHTYVYFISASNNAKFLAAPVGMLKKVSGYVNLTADISEQRMLINK